MKYLTQNLRFLRKKFDKTQTELALMLNKRQSAIGNWENGLAEPSLDDLRTITVFFGVSVDEFVWSDLSKGNLNENEPTKDGIKKGNLKGNLMGNLIPENSNFSTNKENKNEPQLEVLSAILEEIKIIRVGFNVLGQDVGQIKDKVLSE